MHRSLALLGLIVALALAALLFRAPGRAPTAAPEPAPAVVAPAAAPLATLARAVAERAPAEPLETAPQESDDLWVMDEETVSDASSSAWPRVRHELVAPAPSDTILLFRVVDDAGQPVVDEELTLRVESRSPGHRHSSDDGTTTDGEGQLRVPIASELPDGEQRALEILARDESLSARVALNRSFPPGEVAMGDLVLASAPLVAEGRVTDADGKPLAGAHVFAFGHPVQTGMLDSEDAPYHSAATTAQDGSFALHGDTRVTHVVLSLSDERLVAARREVPVGSRGLEIIAGPGGEIAGRLLLDPGVSVEEFQMSLRRDDGSGERIGSGVRSSSDGALTADGVFRRVRLVPGRYTLSVAIGRNVLAEIPGLEVISGEACRDARLDAIDLRGSLNVFTLELLSPARGVPEGSIAYRASGTSADLHTQRFRGSRVALVTPLPSIDAIVCTVACRTERLSHLAERTELRLRPALSVRLALPPGITLPAPPRFVGTWIDPPRTEERGLDMHLATSPTFDEHGELLLQTGEPGAFTVLWFLERRERSGGGGRGPLALSQPIVIADREGEQRIELAVTQRELDEALAR
jgi:hypothetical protein